MAGLMDALKGMSSGPPRGHGDMPPARGHGDAPPSGTSRGHANMKPVGKGIGKPGNVDRTVAETGATKEWPLGHEQPQQTPRGNSRSLVNFAKEINRVMPKGRG